MSFKAVNEESVKHETGFNPRNRIQSTKWKMDTGQHRTPSSLYIGLDIYFIGTKQVHIFFMEGRVRWGFRPFQPSTQDAIFETMLKNKNRKICEIREETEWSSTTSFPFPTNYNDHFETPIQAYIDIVPAISWLIQQGQLNKVECKKCSLEPTIYDPYYCNGRTKDLLRQLGFEKVIHEKRDFYRDIAEGSIPIQYDIFISNPPYSDAHKEKCFEFCFKQLRRNQKQMDLAHTDMKGDQMNENSSMIPFLLLLPAYTANKQYYRNLLFSSAGFPSTNEEDVVYLVPQTSYCYDHPEDTGKEICPFESLWFLGVGKHLSKTFKEMWDMLDIPCRPRLATSLKELEEMSVVSLKNRRNPRQRKRNRQTLDYPLCSEVNTTKATTKRNGDGSEANSVERKTNETPSVINHGSKYRDNKGIRIVKRF